MGADEEGTLAALQAHRRECLDLKIAEHRGRIVKSAGDGFLIEFASIVDAARCALAVQRGVKERNAPLPRDKRMEFRIEINVDDVIIQDGDIFGDGVNVASRLEGVADPGGIVISALAHDFVVNRIDADFRELGELSLKNIERPVARTRSGNSATSRRNGPKQCSGPDGPRRGARANGRSRRRAGAHAPWNQAQSPRSAAGILELAPRGHLAA